MPRSNHPRGRQKPESEDLDLGRALIGRLRIESKRDGSWNVQPLGASSANKSYTCPGCNLEVAPRTAHTVAWRADGLMGPQDDLAARRHWHSHCWSIKR